MKLNQILDRRAAVQGSAPLLTYYDLGTGERTEFSARSFANWVTKTANLIGELTDNDGGVVAAPLAVTHPGHWVTQIWPMAAWLAGAGYAVGELDAELVVVGPDAAQPRPGTTVLACSLHPFGLGLRDLPAGVLDFTTSALAQPDAMVELPPPLTDVAWRDEFRTIPASEVAAGPGVAGRVLVRPTDAWTTFTQAIRDPLLGGGSAVVVVGEADDDRVARIRSTEHCVP